MIIALSGSLKLIFVKNIRPSQLVTKCSSFSILGQFWSCLPMACDYMVMRTGSNLWYRCAVLRQSYAIHITFGDEFSAYQFVVNVDFQRSDIDDLNCFVESMTLSSISILEVPARSYASVTNIENPWLCRAFSVQNTDLAIFLFCIISSRCR